MQLAENNEVNMRPIVAASAAGTVMEWYDFVLYGVAAAIVLNQLFFPNVSPTVGVLAAFATFAVGYFVRPLGGFVIGHYGDKIGRKPALIFTVGLMGLATVLMGALPTYDAIGLWAPVLLVLLRLLQGFGAGAELAGAVTYVAEFAPSHKRAFYTSIPFGAAGFGIMLATSSFAIVSFFLSEEQLLAWGWRIPFLSSFVVVFVALFIRQRLFETPAFRQVTQENVHTPEVPVREVVRNLPVSQVFRERGRDVFFGVLSVAGYNVNSYIVITFTLSFIVVTLGLSQDVGTLGLVVASLVGVATTPLFGMLADRIGRRPVLVGAALFTILFTFPFFLLLQTREPGLIVLAMAISFISYGATNGAQPAFLSELFETRYRFTGIASVREINGVIFAGLTPFIATALVAVAGGAPWLLAVYLIGTQILTIVGATFARGALAPTNSERDGSFRSPEDPLEDSALIESREPNPSAKDDVPS